MMREKHSQLLLSPQSDSHKVEVCDICGDAGVEDFIFKCFNCKISQQHPYCGKTYPHNMNDEWYCDDCERETLASPKHVNRDLHKTLASNLSACVHDEGTRSAQNGKHWREEKMVTKGKVKCIPSEEVIKLSSGLKKGKSPVKTFKYSNLSPPRIVEPKCSKTPIHRKGLPLKSPVTPPPLPVNKQINSVIQRLGSPISHVPKDHTGAKDATTVKKTSTPSEALCGRSPDNQFLTPSIPDSVGAKDAIVIKETSMSLEALCGRSPEKQLSPLNSLGKPSVETKVGNLGKEMYKTSEASIAFSLKKQFPQPQPISSAPSEAKDATAVKESSTSGEDLCGQLPEKQFSPLTSPVKPSVETKVARPGKDIYKASEASNALSLEKQFLQPTNSETKTGKDMNVPTEASCAPSPKKQFIQGSTSGHHIVSGVEICEAINVEPKAKIRGPALDYSWRGHFEILSATFKLKNNNSWFKAHPRFRVNRKVLDILSRMPKLLQFKLIRRRDVWTELFQNDCPDEDDIGLYFFSGENKRSSDYDFLRVFIEEKELAMRCDLSGAELFLFTSKVLFADSQKWDEEYFLWGVFRLIKKHKYVSKLYEELPPVDHQLSYSVRNNDFNNDADADNDCAAVDMEIDMLAGKDVGIIDVPIPRNPSSSEGQAKSLPLQLEIKKEPVLDCPPGFEMYRLKLQKN